MIQDIAPQKMYNQFRNLGPEKARGGDTAFVFEGRNIVCHVDEAGSISFPSVSRLLKAGASREHLRYLFSIDEKAYWLFASFEKESGVREVLTSLAREEESGVQEVLTSPGREDESVGQAVLTSPGRKDESGSRAALTALAMENDAPAAAFDKPASADYASVRHESAYTLETLRVLRRTQPKTECYAGETAYHLYVWYRDNVFCGRCGKKLEYSQKERAMSCPFCGNVIYPKIAPAVIVGILNPAKDKIVMTRYAGREYKGHALVAGFCEIGETAEDTVRREVLEEVGLHVRDIHYYKSQPWGFDSNLLFGYYCTADESEPIHMDDGELSRAVWVPREEIGEEARDLSLTAEMIMHFKEAADVR